MIYHDYKIYFRMILLIYEQRDELSPCTVNAIQCAKVMGWIGWKCSCEVGSRPRVGKGGILVHSRLGYSVLVPDRSGIIVRC